MARKLNFKQIAFKCYVTILFKALIQGRQFTKIQIIDLLQIKRDTVPRLMKSIRVLLKKNRLHLVFDSKTGRYLLETRTHLKVSQLQSDPIVVAIQPRSNKVGKATIKFIAPNDSSRVDVAKSQQVLAEKNETMLEWSYKRKR